MPSAINVEGIVASHQPLIFALSIPRESYKNAETLIEFHRDERIARREWKENGNFLEEAWFGSEPVLSINNSAKDKRF